MNRIKTFFHIEGAYKFDYNDLRALSMIINVILIMTLGLISSWFGLAVAVVWLIVDLIKGPRINGMLLNVASIILNIYFLTQFYA